MKVLIVGSGAREYSLALAFSKDPNCAKIYFAPGNGATHALGENISYRSLQELSDFAINHEIDLTVVGSEEPLTLGIVDLFRAYNLTIFGPTAQAARLEGSKAFMKNFLAKHSIPTAKYIETTSLQTANEFIDSLTPPIVVKADGLCAGKGVIIAQSKDEARNAVIGMLSGKSFGSAGKTVVIEEFLDGFELSVFAISDGNTFITLPPCQDHKRLLTGDHGPNTGGMGAYCPAPIASAELIKKIQTRIIQPTISGMRSDGMPFEGVLFCGVMVVNGEPYTLEFNVRFGDPECEELMALLETPACELFYNAATGRLSDSAPRFAEQFAVGVVAASKNYPFATTANALITVEPNAEHANAHISYAGVSLDEHGQLQASGGRVLVCVGTGASVKEAQKNAYELISKVHFEGMQFRSDIAYQALQ